jgi:DNA-binding response OmpR family regulator
MTQDLSLPSPSILLVEADPLQRDLIQLALRRNATPCLHARNGQEAVLLIQQKKPGLLLLDMHLPDQNGLELLESMKASGMLEQVAVIILSSLGYPEIIQRAARAGANEFLIKPLDIDLLQQRVKRLLSSGANLS